MKIHPLALMIALLVAFDAGMLVQEARFLHALVDARQLQAGK